MKIGVKGDPKDIENFVTRWDAALPPMLQKTAYGFTLDVQSEYIKNLSGPVMKRKGVVIDLAKHAAAQSPDAFDGGVSWGLPEGPLLSRIGRFFETGGTVRPKRARFLRIPLRNGPALTGAGYDRYSGTPLRTVPGFFVIRTRAGKVFLARDVGGKHARTELWYTLVRQATIKPHPAFERAITDVTKRVESMLSKNYDEGMPK